MQQSSYVLVPVTGEDLEVVGGDDHSGAGLAHVPDAKRAISEGGGEDVGVAGVLDSRCVHLVDTSSHGEIGRDTC